jgi:hypothetical protein
MKLPSILLALLVGGCCGAQAAPGPTNSASTNRVLLIDPSSMPVASGKATLTIGPLQRTNGVYSGEYKIKVSPYFWKNKKGTLDIVVSDEALASLNQGKVTTVTGTATTSGKGGICRRVEATAAPASVDCGTITLWFTSGGKKMIFGPAYHFSDKPPAAGLGRNASGN